MRFPLLPMIILSVALFPLACTTTRGKAPAITESEPAVSETETPPEEEMKPPAEEEAQMEEATPPAEAESQEPAAAEPPAKAEEAAPQTPLAGGKSLYNVVVVPNLLKLKPDKLTIHVGDTVHFKNLDDKKHFLASVPGSGKTDKLEIFSLMEPGAEFEHTFKVAGEYPYFCFIHNQMTGHITVAE